MSTGRTIRSYQDLTVTHVNNRLRQLHPNGKQADRIRKLSWGSSDNVEISSALLCHFDIHLTHNNFSASLAISTSGCPEDFGILAWQFVARRRWTIANNNSIIFEAIPITDSRRDRECTSGCERNQSSGAAEDFPAGGRGSDDLRSAGGRSLRPRHTKAVCVHCWILSTFSNAHIYISLSHRLAEMRYYWPRANICQQQTKTFRRYYTALARVVPLSPAYIIALLRSWRWRLREIASRFQKNENCYAFLSRQVRRTKWKKMIVRPTTSFTETCIMMQWHVKNPQRLRYRFS